MIDPKAVNCHKDGDVFTKVNITYFTTFSEV